MRLDERRLKLEKTEIGEQSASELNYKMQDDTFPGVVRI